MPTLLIDDQWIAGTARVRASAPDPLAGLHGHAYIAARKLNPLVPKLDPHRADREAAVLNMLAQRDALAAPGSVDHQATPRSPARPAFFLVKRRRA